MPINLSKGQKVDLTKKNPGLKKIMVGLGWDVNAFDSGSDFDLDAAAFMLGANGKCPTEKEFIFYGNLKHASESVIHMGDNLTGEGEGDDEMELIHYDLGEDFSIETAVVVGELYRHNGEWKFNAIGSGFQGGLAALCGHYGIEVA